MKRAFLALAAFAALPAHAQSVRPEARALWVTRFDYDSEAKIARIMETAARAHFNIIYFQARAAADAYYRSNIEPCAALLCGKLGGTPSYDPLEVAVREGHKRGLQVHAYLNALTGRAAGIDGQCKPMPEPDAGNPRHVLLDHPEWVMSDRTGRRLPCPNSEEYVWLSPSFPEVRPAAPDLAHALSLRDFAVACPASGHCCAAELCASGFPPHETVVRCAADADFLRHYSVRNLSPQVVAPTRVTF